ncbi:hypothetical protein SAMN05421755_101159 [Nitrosomonas sp. Nm33]|nr:hypothetical protein SAMN05421755_101159 [Nitrosomonas sp. Nm33]
MEDRQRRSARGERNVHPHVRPSRREGRPPARRLAWPASPGRVVRAAVRVVLPRAGAQDLVQHHRRPQRVADESLLLFPPDGGEMAGSARRVPLARGGLQPHRRASGLLLFSQGRGNVRHPAIGSGRRHRARGVRVPAPRTSTERQHPRGAATLRSRAGQPSPCRQPAGGLPAPGEGDLRDAGLDASV